MKLFLVRELGGGRLSCQIVPGIPSGTSTPPALSMSQGQMERRAGSCSSWTSGWMKAVSRSLGISLCLLNMLVYLLIIEIEFVFFNLQSQLSAIVIQHSHIKSVLPSSLKSDLPDIYPLRLGAIQSILLISNIFFKFLIH